MFHGFKKFFVIFLLFSFLPIRGMEDKENASTQIDLLAGAKVLVNYSTKKYNQRLANIELWNVLWAAHNNNPDNYTSADFANIANCLDKGADPNVQNKHRHISYMCGHTPLSFAAFTKNVTLMEFLIKRGANVNQKNSFFSTYYTPLQVGVGYSFQGNEKVKLLCDAGALLDDAVKYPWSFGNIFHCTTRKETIISLMTHGSFGFKYKNQDQIKFKTVTDVLKKWGGKHQEEEYFFLPDEIQDQIIAYLSPEHFQMDPDSELCLRLLQAGYKQPYIFAHIYQRVEGIKQLLQSSSLARGTAVEYMQICGFLTDEQKEELRPLLDGSMLGEHYRKFNEEFPSILADSTNLITLMYGSCAKLLEGKK